MNAPLRSAKSGVSLDELTRRLAPFGAVLSGSGEVRVTDVREDSRSVQEGDLFVARKGARSDGARFTEDAVSRGARAVLVGKDDSPESLAVPVLRVADVARALGFAAEVVQGEPSRAVDVVGVTGTNGKTTATWLLAQALGSAGARVPAARLGTLGYACGEDSVDDTMTTPPADVVTRFLARARDSGARHFVMEVSSHALAQHRVDALRFAAAAFTNLTRDHLDYHTSMRDYGEAKARLFTALSPSVSVLNTDDAFGAELARRARGRIVRVGTASGNDVRPLDVVVDAAGINGKIAVFSEEIEVACRFLGHHNLENLLLVLGVVAGLGLDVAAASRALAEASQVPGRLERCDGAGDDVLVLVDYAHTPDALGRALEAVRPLSRGRVACVFGCGGDRDPGKRRKMGEAVGLGADTAVVTNDNPRSEDPEAIAAAIVAGLAPHGIPFEVVLARSAAIERAVLAAEPGDVVLIAGKGHEPVQIVGNESFPFDDRREARRALDARRKRGVD